MNKPTPVVLSVAGSDPMSGAGIQADIKTAAALQGYCCAVITAITAQNSRGVDAVWPTSVEQLEAQFRAVMTDLTPGAIKVGMVASTALLNRLRQLLEEFAPIPVVIDPVLKATAGDTRLGDAKLDLRDLFPLATVITPNLDEASYYLGRSAAKDLDEMQQQARDLLALGSEAVLLKGGHMAQSDAPDVLAQRDGSIKVYREGRVMTAHTHGTGCTLSTAIAVGLAAGKPLEDVVANAKLFVSQALANAQSLALVPSNGPLQHFF